jgi:hypothetical protein
MILDYFLDSDSITPCFQGACLGKGNECHRDFAVSLMWPSYDACVLHERMTKEMAFKLCRANLEPLVGDICG